MNWTPPSPTRIAQGIDKKLRQALKIDGFMPPQELAWIALAAEQADSIIEVGCYKGRSTRAWCDFSPETAKVTAIDSWLPGPFKNYDGEIVPSISFDVQDEFMANLYDHIVTGKLVVKRTHFTAHTVTTPADIIFIDAEHRKLDVERDIRHALPLLKPGGVLCGHDYNEAAWPDVTEVVDFWFGPAVKSFRTIWYVQP